MVQCRLEFVGFEDVSPMHEMIFRVLLFGQVA